MRRLGPRLSGLASPRDIAQAARSIIDQVTGEIERITPQEGNEAARLLGHLGGIKGGKARAEKLTAAQRANGFSKKALNLQQAVALNFVHNLCRKHSTTKMTPAIAAELTDRIWTLHDLASLPDLMRGEAAA